AEVGVVPRQIRAVCHRGRVVAGQVVAVAARPGVDVALPVGVRGGVVAVVDLGSRRRGRQQEGPQGQGGDQHRGAFHRLSPSYFSLPDQRPGGGVLLTLLLFSSATAVPGPIPTSLSVSPPEHSTDTPQTGHAIQPADVGPSIYNHLPERNGSICERRGE